MRVAQYLNSRVSVHSHVAVGSGRLESPRGSDCSADDSFLPEEPEPLQAWSLRARVHAFRELFAQGSHGVSGCFATDTLVCACQGDIVWKAERGFHVPSMTAMISKLSPFHCCGGSLASFSQVLVLTNAGELHVERHHDVGNFTVEWSSNNRLIKFS